MSEADSETGDGNDLVSPAAQDMDSVLVSTVPSDSGYPQHFLSGLVGA